MIEFSCTSCGAPIRVADDAAGRSGTCLRCEARVRVPAGREAGDDEDVAFQLITASRAEPRAVTAVDEMASKVWVPEDDEMELPGRRPAQQIVTGESRTSALAVASMVLSLAGIVFNAGTFLAGIICGHLARRELRSDPALAGSQFATVGLVVGYCGLVLTAIVVSVVLALFGWVIPGAQM